jgi:hypothetical protein
MTDPRGCFMVTAQKNKLSLFFFFFLTLWDYDSIFFEGIICSTLIWTGIENLLNF